MVFVPCAVPAWYLPCAVPVCCVPCSFRLVCSLLHWRAENPSLYVVFRVPTDWCARCSTGGLRTPPCMLCSVFRQTGVLAASLADREPLSLCCVPCSDRLVCSLLHWRAENPSLYVVFRVPTDWCARCSTGGRRTPPCMLCSVFRQTGVLAAPLAGGEPLAVCCVPCSDRLVCSLLHWRAENPSLYVVFRVPTDWCVRCSTALAGGEPLPVCCVPCSDRLVCSLLHWRAENPSLYVVFRVPTDWCARCSTGGRRTPRCMLCSVFRQTGVLAAPLAGGEPLAVPGGGGGRCKDRPGRRHSPRSHLPARAHRDRSATLPVEPHRAQVRTLS